MNTHELKARLNAEVEAVCHHLFPGGKREAGEWCCGSISGEAGNSFKIHLTGGLVGQGKDWSEPGSKLDDLLGLWQRARGLDFLGARKAAHEYLGIADTPEKEFHRAGQAGPKTYTPADNSLAQPLQSGGVVFDYLTKARKLEAVTLNRYGVGQIVHPKIGPAVVFPCFAPGVGKQPDLIKYLALERQTNGKKNILASTGSRPRLFGWQASDRTKRDGHLTEGEIDCLTLAQNGFHALSLSMGTGDLNWIEQDHDALESFERIFLWMDMDAAGHKCAEILAHRLGRERCYRVRIPAPWKDVNEAMLAGACDADMQDWVDAARTLDPGELCGIADFRDAAWEVLHPTTQATLGTLPPVALDWRCRFGELSIWTGISGHGKSALLNHFAVHDAAQGEKICIASMEMPAADQAAQLARIALGYYPGRHEADRLDEAMAWLNGKFWLVNKLGVMPLARIRPLFTYAARRYGCTRFIIDSLGRLGVREDDNDGQAAIISELVDFASTLGHVHLVCHPKKQDDEAKGPGKMAVRGSVAMTDNCNNGFTVWRNKDKESKMELFTKVRDVPTERAKAEAEPDAQIKMWKNRKTGQEPFQTLWFHRDSGQFLNSRLALPRNYLTQSVP